MKCTVLHNSDNRIRVHLEVYRMSLAQADVLEYYLRNVSGVTDVKVFDRTCDAIIRYSGEKSAVTKALSVFSFDDENAIALVPEHTGRELNRHYADRLANRVIRRVLSRVFLPYPVRAGVALLRSGKYLLKCLKSILRREIEVSVLDATAIAVAMLQGDFQTASSIMFLLDIGDILDEWTHKKSVDDLVRSMALQVDMVWKKEDGQEYLTPIEQIKAGDEVVVRMGSMIPLDGKVTGGEAMVNQASMTGEGIPVRKAAGSYVYAGTVVEEGQCTIQIDKAMGGGRYDRIVQMIEESEKLKSDVEDKASHLADRLVPFNLAAAGLIYLITRNATKASAALMVDYSCALKLSLPIAVLSAMRESSNKGITVKGGRFMEIISDVDTIVFDKTGTMTYAEPKVAGVVSFGGEDETEMLRLAACLEEHYPHSIANAVVREASNRGLLHEERHTEVEYVVAHGISSSIEGKKALIGSYHFVFEDEGAVIPPGEESKYESLPDAYSHLYLALDGVLAAVILIEDPIREEAPAVIRRLHELGAKRIVMMTGDNARTARAVAALVGVDEYHAEVLPEDKAAFIKAEHEAGRTVVMIGDGVNDSPALSEADAGIAISDGAAIAREIADVTIKADDLYSLVTLKETSDALMDRIHGSYRFIMTFNTALIVLGVGGILTPAMSALAHNASTIAVSLRNMTPLLPENPLGRE